MGHDALNLTIADLEEAEAFGRRDALVDAIDRITDSLVPSEDYADEAVGILEDMLREAE